MVDAVNPVTCHLSALKKSRVYEFLNSAALLVISAKRSLERGDVNQLHADTELAIDDLKRAVAMVDASAGAQMENFSA